MDELGQTIGDAADSILAFDDALGEASKSLTNIPETFKLGSAEWAARGSDTAALTGAARAARIPLDPVSLRAPLPPRPGDGASLPPFGGASGSGAPVLNGTVINLTVTVPGANKSIGDIARAVKDEFDHAILAAVGLGQAP